MQEQRLDFLWGRQHQNVRSFETKDAIKKGADEIDYVINVAELKNKNYDYIKKRDGRDRKKSVRKQERYQKLFLKTAI